MAFFLRKICKQGISPCPYAQTDKQTKEPNCPPLTKNNIRWLYWLLPQITKEHEVSNKSPHLNFVQPTERRTTATWFVHVGQSCQSSKNQTNSPNTRELVRNATQDRIYPKEVPFRYNVPWCRIRICWNVVIWVSQKFWVKVHQISSTKTQPQSSYQIFCIKIGIKVNKVRLRINSQRVCRSVLMQCPKVYLTQPPQNKRKQIVETVKSVKGWVIYGKATPLPTNNTRSNKRQSTCLTCNYCPSPKTHLSPWLYVTNKSCQNHNQQNNNSNQPYKFTRLCITCVVQTTEEVHVHNNKKQTPSICMQITQLPTIWYITHQVLNTMKCLIYMSSIVHCQKNTSPDLQNKTQSSQNTPIIISIQIRRCWITNQVILCYSQHGLIPQATTQFFERSFH